MRKIGIFGGTFNPIHTAHLILAEAALSKFDLDRIIFIPNNIPVHKTSDFSFSSEERLELVSKATETNIKFFVSDYEIKKGGLSYTVDTLEYFKDKYPDSKLYFIIGGDSLRDFSTWREPKRISELATLLVYPRDDIDLEHYKKALADEYGAEIELLAAPSLEISSSAIREKLKNGEAIRYMVPESIYLDISRLFKKGNN